MFSNQKINKKNFLSMSNQVHEFQILEKIGRGRYGTAYRAFSHRYKCEFCVKIISNSSTDPLTKFLCHQEAETLRLVDHINVIRLYDFFEENDHFYIVMEYCPGENMHNMIKTGGCFSLSQINMYFRQILLAMSYFHSLGIVHRDIKPSNIAFDPVGRPKILDWGYSTIVDNHKPLTTFCGSIPYISPECLDHIPYDGKSADIWSLGVTMFYCAFGEDPWKGSKDNLRNGVLCFPDEVLNNIQNWNNEIQQDDFKESNCNNHCVCQTRSIMNDFIDLLKKMVSVNPKERITAKEALKHPFFKNTVEHLNSNKTVSLSSRHDKLPFFHSNQCYIYNSYKAKMYQMRSAIMKPIIKSIPGSLKQSIHISTFFD